MRLWQKYLEHARQASAAHQARLTKPTLPGARPMIGAGMVEERCALCGCLLVRGSRIYAKPTVEGRAHATKHHYVAERFFGRSGNRRGEERARIFEECPWGLEGETDIFCYECHEEIIHNPVFVRHDVERLARLVRKRGLSEDIKPENRAKLAARIQLLHEVIDAGLDMLLARTHDDP
jgi:hypothetical protein